MIMAVGAGKKMELWHKCGMEHSVWGLSFFSCYWAQGMLGTILGQRGGKTVKMADSGSNDLWQSLSDAEWKPKKMSWSNETDECCCWDKSTQRDRQRERNKDRCLLSVSHLSLCVSVLWAFRCCHPIISSIINSFLLAQSKGVSSSIQREGKDIMSDRPSERCVCLCVCSWEPGVQMEECIY